MVVSHRPDRLLEDASVHDAHPEALLERLRGLRSHPGLTASPRRHAHPKSGRCDGETGWTARARTGQNAGPPGQRAARLRRGVRSARCATRAGGRDAGRAGQATGIAAAGIVPAKVRAPRVRWLARERLDQLVPQLWQHRLTLVVAPAGSGKTTLLAAWAGLADAPAAWYRAESVDGSERPWRPTSPRPSQRRSRTWPAAGARSNEAAAALDARPEAAPPPRDRRPPRPDRDARRGRPGALPRLRAAVAGSRRRDARGRRHSTCPGVASPGSSWSCPATTSASDRGRWSASSATSTARRYAPTSWPASPGARRAGRPACSSSISPPGQAADERQRLLAGLGPSSRLMREYLTRNVVAELPDELREFLVGTCVLRRLTGASAIACSTGRAAGRSSRSWSGAASSRWPSTTRAPTATTRSCAATSKGCSSRPSARRRRARAPAAAGELLEGDGAIAEAVAAYSRAEDWAAVDRLLDRHGERLAAGQGAWMDTLPPALLVQDPWLILATARRHRAEGRWAQAIDAYGRAEALFGSGEAGAACRRERLASPPGSIRCPAPASDWSGALRAAVAHDPLVRRPAGDGEPGRLVAAGLAPSSAGGSPRRAGCCVVPPTRSPAGPVLGIDCRPRRGRGRAPRRRSAGRRRDGAGRCSGGARGPRLARPRGSGGALDRRRARGRGVRPLGRDRCARGSGARRGSLGRGPRGARRGLGRDARAGGGARAARGGRGPLPRPRGREPGGMGPRAGGAGAGPGRRARRPRGGPGRRGGGALHRHRGRGGRRPSRPRGAGPGRRPASSGSAADGLLAEAGRRPARGRHGPPARDRRGTPCRRARRGAIRARAAGRGPPLRVVRDGRRRPPDRSRRPEAPTSAPSFASWPSTRDAPSIARCSRRRSGRRRTRRPARRACTSPSPRCGGSWRRAPGGAPASCWCATATPTGSPCPTGRGSTSPTSSRPSSTARTRRARGATQVAVEAFRAALAAYGGELLPEDGPAEWAAGRRDRARAEVVEAARALAELLLDHDPAGAAEACTAGLALDPHHDPLWRLLVEARERAGDQAAATSARSGYARMLAELGVAAADAA